MPFIAGLLGVVAFALNDLLYRVTSGCVNSWLMIVVLNTGLLGLAAVGLLARKESFWPQKFLGWPLGLALVKTLNIFFALLTFQYLPVAFAYLIIFTYPVWVALADGLIKKSFAKRYWGSLALALIGVGLVYFKGGATFNIGILWALLTALGVGAGILISHRMPNESSLKLSFSNALTCMVVGAVGYFVTRGVVPAGAHEIEVWQWALLIIFSVTGSLAGLYASQKISSVRYALLCYLQIPVAVILAWVLLGEKIDLPMGIGLTLIVVGSLIAQMRKSVPQKDKTGLGKVA